MEGKRSFLDARYVIDGVIMDVTPAGMIASAGGEISCPQEEEGDGAEGGVDIRIVDESADIQADEFDSTGKNPWECLSIVRSCPEQALACPAAYADSFSRIALSTALINALWTEGHFRLEDLDADVFWKWEDSGVGSMAAFYISVREICDWADSLGLRLADCGLGEGNGRVCVNARIADDGGFFDELRPRSDEAMMTKMRSCAPVIQGDESNWLVYIPFVPEKFRLGGSLLSRAAGVGCGKGPVIDDADYFKDCYEVVREMVEDGIVLSGVTVGPGGLMDALARITKGKGAKVSIAGIMKSYSGADQMQVLFSEIPGVVIEISGEDYDYIDAELLLQDVAYYPLGNPCQGGLEISGEGSGIQDILRSLMDRDALEGED